MKFIVDECVGQKVTLWLRSKGYDTVSVVEKMYGQPDSVILSKAIHENRIIITQDKDFGELVFKHNNTHTGIILLRLIDQKSVHKISILEEIFAKHILQIYGCFIIAKSNSIRIIQPHK